MKANRVDLFMYYLDIPRNRLHGAKNRTAWYLSEPPYNKTVQPDYTGRYFVYLRKRFSSGTQGFRFSTETLCQYSQFNPTMGGVNSNMRIRPCLSYFLLSLTGILMACAASKPRRVAIQIDYQPKGVPFQRIGYQVTAGVGKQHRVVPWNSQSHLFEYIEYSVYLTEMKKYKDIIAEFTVLDGDSSKIIEDNAVFRDSCEIVYNVKKKNEPPAKNSIIIYSNDSLTIFKTEDNDCRQ
jgi:hypothetical protein